MNARIRWAEAPGSRDRFLLAAVVWVRGQPMMATIERAADKIPAAWGAGIALRALYLGRIVGMAATAPMESPVAVRAAVAALVAAANEPREEAASAD